MKNDLSLAKIRTNRYIIGGSTLLIMLLGILFLQQRKQRHIVDEKNKNIVLFNKELAHRTKNQIALIANLISNQKKLVSVLSPKELIEDLNNKVQALAEVNKSLNTNEDNLEIELEDIFKAILENNIYSLSSKEINVNVDSVGQQIEGSKATQLALIVNELSTNSIKYAINEVENPEIKVMIRKDNSSLYIDYSDNGTTSKNSISYVGQGTELIRGITHYLSGEINTSFNENGYLASLKIPV